MSKNGLTACLALVTSLTALAQDSIPASPKVWTLEDCIGYAIENNITIRQSRLNTESAAADIMAAKGNMFPSLSFSASQTVFNRPFQDNTTTISGTEILTSNSSTSYTGSYGLNAQWTLFNGGRIRKTLKQNEIAYEQSELDSQTQTNSILEDVSEERSSSTPAAFQLRITRSSRLRSATTATSWWYRKIRWRTTNSS